MLSAELLIAAWKREDYKSGLVELTDEELINIYRTCEERFGNKKFHHRELASMPEEFYRGAAAFDILKERHGDEFVEGLFRMPQPKTLIGRILSYFLG